MRLVRWVTLVALGANLLLIGFNLKAAHDLRLKLAESSATLAWVTQLRVTLEKQQPHPCGTVLQPGESCYVEIPIAIPRKGRGDGGSY